LHCYLKMTTTVENIQFCKEYDLQNVGHFRV